MKPSLFLIALTALAGITLHAQDTSLKDNLTPDGKWELAVEGYTFTDGLASDVAGNLLFSDVKEGKGIYVLGLDGKSSLLHDNLPGVSGVHVAQDGRIFACQSKLGRVISIGKDGVVKELIAGVKPNDLIVTPSGVVYFTETGSGRIHAILPDGKALVADEGHVTKPNGITISPDGSTLAVSEHGGKKVWAWQIQPDGTLKGAEAYMTLEVSPNNAKGEALGDGGTTDEKGRYYFTSESGIQVFDSMGRLSGVIAKPFPEAKIVSAEFAGEGHAWLFMAAGDKIFKRRMNTAGAWWKAAGK